jgi:hypothetical protein
VATSEVRCPNCNVLLIVTERHVFSVNPPELPTEMVVTEDGETVHRYAIPPAAEFRVPD